MDWLKFGQNAFKEVLFEKRISIFLWAKIIALSKEKYKSIKLIWNCLKGNAILIYNMVFK